MYNPKGFITDANAQKYLQHESNDFNLSVMISKRYRKNTFQADSEVVLKEFVYMGRQLETVESPFSQIAISLAQFLETGEYVDTTGIAKLNVSPPFRRRKETINY